MISEGQEDVFPLGFRSQETDQILSISFKRGGPSHNSQFKTLYVEYSSQVQRSAEEDRKMEGLKGRFGLVNKKINYH